MQNLPMPHTSSTCLPVVGVTACSLSLRLERWSASESKGGMFDDGDVR